MADRGFLIQCHFCLIIIITQPILIIIFLFDNSLGLRTLNFILNDCVVNFDIALGAEARMHSLRVLFRILGALVLLLDRLLAVSISFVGAYLELFPCICRKNLALIHELTNIRILFAIQTEATSLLTVKDITPSGQLCLLRSGGSSSPLHRLYAVLLHQLLADIVLLRSSLTAIAILMIRHGLLAVLSFAVLPVFPLDP